VLNKYLLPAQSACWRLFHWVDVSLL